MKRRDYLAGAAGVGAAGLAGCVGFRTGGGPSGTLTVATYPSWVEGDSPAGPWVKQQFEQEFDATVEYTTPESRLNYYVRRAKEGVPIEADVYVGLNVDDFITVDRELDDPLFDDMRGDLARADAVNESLLFDPHGRAVPYDTGHIAIVFDESAVPRPETFDALTTDEYANSLLVENAQTSATGRAFMLWTVHEFGPDGYLDYWRRLKSNGITVVGSWSDAYNAYSNEEKPMVVSYGNDQVFANRYGSPMERHQVAFLNDQGYANPEGMARFDTAGDADLAAAFMNFMLRPDIQGGIAVRNVQFPAVTDAELPEEFAKYAQAPENPVTFTYDELKGRMDGWIEDWAREIAQG